MNALKNLFSALAFVMAIGAAFAFTPVNKASIGQIPAKGQLSTCPEDFVDEACVTTTEAQTCFLINQPLIPAVPNFITTECQRADVLTRP